MFVKKFFTPFVISLVLSVILHSLFIAGISEIGGFDFFIPLTRQIFFARLVTEAPRPTVSRSSLKNAPRPDTLFQKGPEGPDGTATHADSTDIKETPAGPTEKEAGTVVLPEGGKAENAPEGGTAKAEPPPPVEAKAKEKSSGLLRASREKLSFDIYWMNIFVGRAVLEAVSSSGTLKITSQVHSSQFISNFYKVEDFTESVLKNGLPSNSKIRLRQGKSRSDKETVFDAANKKITFFNYIKGTKDEHTFQGPVIWDYISGFYFLRTQLLELGKTISIDIFDSNKFLKAEVNVLAREKVKLHDESEIDAVVITVLKSEGMFQSKGEIRIWLTDNESKVPVRIEMKVPIGMVTAELKSLETEQ